MVSVRSTSDPGGRIAVIRSGGPRVVPDKMKRLASYLSVVALGGLVAVMSRLPPAAHATAAVTPAHGSPLAPDPAVVRYRWGGAAATSELDSTIHQLEDRLKVPTPSAMDMSDLAELYLHRAQTQGDADDYARAEQLATRSVELLPAPSSAPLTLARVANARHAFREAIALATPLAEHGRSSAPYVVLATAHLALGELGAASEAAEIAVDRKPTSGNYLMRALVLQAQGRDDEAAFDFARAAALEQPGDPDEAARTRALWGRFLLRRGELAGAEAVLAEAVRIAPGYPLALAQQAELALHRGDTRQARTLFEHAFATSRQVRYLIDLARAQDLAGDRAAAASSRTQVEKLVRDELATRGYGHQLDLVEILVDRGTPGDLAEALRLAREELARRPSADTRFQLARALARSGARDEAMVHVHAALATGVRDARLYELAAHVERGPRAALYAQEADRLDPGGSGWRRLGLDPIAGAAPGVASR